MKSALVFTLLLSATVFAATNKPVIIKGLPYICLRYAENTLIKINNQNEPNDVARDEFSVFVKAGPYSLCRTKADSRIEKYLWCNENQCTGVETSNEAGGCMIKNIWNTEAPMADVPTDCMTAADLGQK
jgi:hypothetical protein